MGVNSRFFDYNADHSCFARRQKRLGSHAVDALWLNPSSPYRAAARVHAHLEAARTKVAVKLAVEPERVLFNSGATEGNNAVFAHWADSLPADATIGVSPTEHPSVIEAANISLLSVSCGWRWMTPGRWMLMRSHFSESQPCR